MATFAARIIRSLILICLCSLPFTLVRGSTTTPTEQPVPAKVFDLTVSLEWTPGADDTTACSRSTGGDQPYLTDLALGLRRMAALLYYATEGQMSLGTVRIYTGGAHWDEADLRILANTAYRPSAWVGGIVDTPQPYISPMTGKQLVFRPGAILLGRLWDGKGSGCGPWSAPAGWRTLAHEWGHYGLYLLDGYADQFTAGEAYCTTTGFRRLAQGEPAPDTINTRADSLMAYHYTTDKLWHGDLPNESERCAWTPQMQTHGQSDWATLLHFYGSTLQAPPQGGGTELDWEASPAAQAFRIEMPELIAQPTGSIVQVQLMPLGRAKLVGESYLIRPRSPDDPTPLRIYGQGQVLTGAATPFWGVTPTGHDRVAVVVQDPLRGQRFYYPQDYRSLTTATLVPGTTTQILVQPSRWQPNLLLRPVAKAIGTHAAITGLDVEFADAAQTTELLQVVYCPAGGDCQAPVNMAPDGTGSFRHTFDFGNAGPALHGYIYLRNPATGEETVSWYQLAGGVGPAAGDGHAPLSEGLAALTLATGQIAGEGFTIYYPAQRAAAASAPWPGGVTDAAGVPLDLQPVRFDGPPSAAWNRNDPPLDVRVSYNEQLLAELGIDEQALVLVRLDAPLQSAQPQRSVAAALAATSVPTTTSTADATATATVSTSSTADARATATGSPTTATAQPAIPVASTTSTTASTTPEVATVTSTAADTATAGVSATSTAASIATATPSTTGVVVGTATATTSSDQLPWQNIDHDTLFVPAQQFTGRGAVYVLAYRDAVAPTATSATEPPTTPQTRVFLPLVRR